ncbi:DUF6531 domain-containing protein [Ulvibacter litoralis]|nr:DUF6531 domain-containing protein [Ulvibacter litoralis]
MDPVMGIDIHITMIPSPAGPIPIPLPYPFVGMIFDPMDYVPFIGSTINVSKVPRGNSTTSGMLGTMVHIPMGGPLLMNPTIGHDSANFFGSSKVVTEGSYMSPSGYMVMSCNDIGVPLTASPGKKMKPKLGMYLPSSATIPIPSGPPVMVGGPYTPDFGAMLMGLAMSFGMGSLMKAAGKGLKKLNHAVLKKFPGTQGLSKKLCKLGFEPIDLVTGRMIYEGEDFSIPGIIPVEWGRNWYSDSEYRGILGYGMHSNYDIVLHIENKDQAIVMRLADGRVTDFPLLIAEGDSFYDRTEKLTLTCIDGNTYTVKEHETDRINTFTKVSNTLLKLTSISNVDDFKIQFHYNGAHNLVEIIDTAGRKIDITNDSEGRIVKAVALHEGEQRLLVEYAYNEEGDLIGITDALGQTTKMEYKNHLMVKKTDRNGQAFYWEYDGKTTGAKCIKTWGDGGILSGTLHYGKGQNLTINSLGEETIYYYDSNNLCTQVTNPEGGHIFHEYTEFMEPYRDIDEEGNITGYTYDQRGNLVGIHHPDGTVTSFVYNENDKLILTKTPAGTSMTKVYEDDKVFATINPDGAVTSFIYGKNGLLKKIRDNEGKFTELKYDSDYNVSKMIFPNGGVSKWNYNIWGECIQTTNPAKHKQQFSYDVLGRVKKIKLTDDNIINLKYNAYDEVIETIDSKRHKINFEYTPLGSLKLREESGSKVQFKYNTEEQLLAIINEHKEYYRFGRNKNGEIINETGFDGLRREYQRDRAGKVLKVVRPENRFSEFEYDLNGRITRTEHSDGTWETFSYNDDGLLIEAVNQNSTVQITRDESGKVVSEVQDGHLVESTYDNAGNRIGISSSLGADITLKRNEFGLIEQVDAMAEGHDTAWTSKMSYNSIGQEIERVLPGGITNKMAYDKAGRPIQHTVSRTNKELRHRTYAWNISDQLHKMVNELTSGVVSYTYDSFGSLASARYEDKQFDYKLPDEVGNIYRTKEKSDRKYGAGGKLLEASGNKYKYDQEGNLILKSTLNGNWEYKWQGNGMLQSVVKPDGDTLTFEYDALGRRTAKILVPRMNHKDRIITRWVWNGNVPLHEWKYKLEDRPQWMVNEFGDLTQDKEEPLGLPKQPILEALKTSETSEETVKVEENVGFITWIFEEGTFKPAAKIVDGEQFSIITDYLGTPVEMYNSGGQKTWEVEYDIYGKVRKLVTGSLNDCPFRYQGQFEDVETGLYYNRYRYYNADEGAYISQDPIGLDGGMPNMYSYVSDSNTFVDLFGMMPTWMPTKQGYQRHHMIPKSLQNHPAFKASGMNIDGASNMKYLPVAEGIDSNPNKSLHKGWNETHSEYNKKMKGNLDAINTRAMTENWDQKRIQDEILDLQRKTRADLDTGKIKCG